MPACEKCWSDAQRRVLAGGYEGVADAYRALVRERGATGRECTPEQQAGPDAGVCTACGRRTAHQHCGICMACGHDPKPVAP